MVDVSGPLPIDLLRRRAELVGVRVPTDAQRRELDDVTEALRSELVAPAMVRPLRVDTVEDEALVRRLAALEPVNPLRGDADLRDRVDADRRVVVLEHPALPGHPMNVVWVALCEAVPARLADVLDPAAPCLDPSRARVAVFYSIWNAEPGLVGLGRGVDLLDGAVEQLGAELPTLETYVTLSPVPGFRPTAERDGSADGTEEPPELARRCARYLVSFRDGRLLDPVARFHMGNGARLLRVCPGGDPSPQGMRRSWGVMANYRYAPEDRVANRAALAQLHPAVGDDVAKLVGAAG
jgi:malonyl-CoA decarboxylase